MKTYQMSPSSFKNWVELKRLLNNFSNKRIKRETLDFYRNSVIGYANDGNDVIIIVEVADSNSIVGVSACTIRKGAKRQAHSITVVDSSCRKMGVGKRLLSKKLEILSKRHPKIGYRLGVADSNVAAINMCMSSGLCAVDSGANDKNGVQVEYTVFEL